MVKRGRKEKGNNADIKGTKYTFRFTTAVCNECGEEMGVPGLIDMNIREFEEQYNALSL